MTEIVMPKLSDSMEEGLVLQWLIEDGQPVAVGDELVEIETDKATMTYESEVEGMVSIVVAAGTTVAVGEVIARVSAGVAREGVIEPGAAEPDVVREGGIEPAAAEPGVAREGGIEPAAAEPDVAVPAQPRAALTRGNGGGRPLVTPVARRLAALHGVALAELTGSGPRGRITKADVLGAAGLEARAAPAAPPAAAAANGTRELTRTQRLIARRMAESKATIPHFQVQTEVEMDRAVALRAELKAIEDPPPSINDLIVRAAALALRGHPIANASYRGERFELHEQVNVGIAVATEGALVVPTVFEADRKSVRRIAEETRRLAARVRSGEITPPELSGATFTVSNLGMYGMTAITPVIDPPQAAILGVGAVREVLARREGEIVDRRLLTLTLSCDHRILYGADAARFLAEIRQRLEQPLRLLV